MRAVTLIECDNIRHIVSLQAQSSIAPICKTRGDHCFVAISYSLCTAVARACVCVCVCVFSLSCQDLLTADPLGDAGWLQWSRLQWSRLHADSLVFVALEQVYECQSCVASHCMSRHASKQMRSRVVYMLVPPLSCPMLPLKYSSFSVPTRCPSNVFGLLCAWLL